MTEDGTNSKRRAASALDRCKGEGGAQPLPWVTRCPSSDLGENERQVLDCLGAAVVSGWNEFPTDVQRKIFEQAASETTYDPARLREQIARFLHNHKDDQDTPDGDTP